MLFPRKAKGMLLKPKKSNFDNLGNLSGRRSLSFNLELVGRNSPISTPKVVEEVPAPEAFPASANGIWQKNNKPRFRLPIKFPKLKIPFISNRKERLEDSSHSFEEVSQSASPSTPFNHDLHDSYSSVHGFAHESYAQTEIALTEIGRSVGTSTHPWGLADASMPYLNRTSLDPHLLLPPTTETNGEMAEYCPADDEFFRVTPRASLQRDWLSSPEDEIENDWRSGSDSTAPKRRRPSSAYGWTGSSHRSLDTDRRDSSSTVDAPLPPRPMVESGSRTPLQIDTDLPVSFPALGSLGSMASPESQADATEKPKEGGAPIVPALFLGNVSGHGGLAVSETSGRRVGRHGFGSDIPVLEEFAGLSSEGSQRSLARSDEEVDQASSCGTMKESDIDSLFSDDDNESDYDAMTPDNENLRDIHYTGEDSDIEEECSRDLSADGHSSRFVADEDLEMECPAQGEVQFFTGSDDDVASYYGLPCMTEHPDEPDFENCYPTTMVSDDATSRSQEERDLAGFAFSLQNKPMKTVLDVLEERTALKRKECSFRVACQRNFIRKMKNKVHKSKVAFTRLRQGLGPQLTDKVEQLRQKWGGGMRVRRREKLIKLQEKDDEELWDLHFNEYEAQEDSDADLWVTDDDNCFEA